MIDPICHSSISQDMGKTFIILFDQFCDFLIFPFLPWNDSMFPFIERSPCNSKLFAHPADAPAVVCIEVFNCQILWFVALFAQPHIPSNSFTFLTVQLPYLFFKLMFEPKILSSQPFQLINLLICFVPSTPVCKTCLARSIIFFYPRIHLAIRNIIECGCTLIITIVFNTICNDFLRSSMVVFRLASAI